MNFAINYSPQAAAALQAGQIEIDYFKCPDWDNLVTAAQPLRPVYIHFPLLVGAGSTPDFAAVEQWLARSDTLFVNAHVEVLAEAHAPDTPDAAILEMLLHETQALVDAFGADRVILENIPQPDAHEDLSHLPLGVQPETLRLLCEETGCGFLFDISHAQLTCERLGFDFETYVTALPLERLRELHITGIADFAEGRRGDHMPLLEADWARLDWLLARIRSGQARHPEMMAFEYGGIGPYFEWRSEPAVIAAQVPRLYALAHSLAAQHSK